MITTAYLNGRFLPIEDAKVSPLDRGFTLGDGVYEVIPVYDRKCFYLEPHLDRLNQSLQGIQMLPPHSHKEWREILETLVEKNDGTDQYIYLHITRGFQPLREHPFPKEIIPTVFAVSYPKPRMSKAEQAKGMKITLVTDLRWKYCHIKTTSRLAYVLMHQKAKDAGFDEAIIMNTGYAFEGTISNFFIVRHGVIITPPKSSQLLSGITRDIILMIAEKNKIPYRETKVSEGDLLKADEIWITSSTRGVSPVFQLNEHPVGTQNPGPLWEKMWDLYAAEITKLSLPVSP